MRRLKSNESIILSIVILLLVSATQSINVYLNGELHHFNTPYSRYGRIEFNITGAGLAVADPIDLCSEQLVDWTNKIVITSKVGCSPQTKIRLAQERGAVAIIAHETSTNGPSGNVYWRTVDGMWAPDTSLPFVTINAPDGDALKSLIWNTTANDTLIADVDPNDFNEWVVVLDTSNAYMGVAIALTLANLAGLGFALSRLISLIMAKGCKRTTAHLTLSFICAMHTSTIIYYVVQVIDIKMGPVAPDIFYAIFLIMPELLQMLSSLVVSLYWFELINSVTSKPMMFLKKLIKPFVAFAIIISVLYVVVIIMSGLYLADLVIIIFLLVFLILSLAVAIIWLIVGAKLIHQLRNNAKLRENKKKASNFNRLSTFIILCAVFLFLTRTMYLVIGLDPDVYADPWFWLPIATLIYIFQLVTAFIQTGLFKLHKRDFKSTTTSKGSDHDPARNSHRASVHGGMNMSAIATKGESVNDTLSEEPLVSGEETKRTATSAASDVFIKKESSDESSSQKEASNEMEEKSHSTSQSEKEEDNGSRSSSETSSVSNSG